MHVWEKEELHTGFWWENLREGEHLRGPGVDGRIILKLIIVKKDGSTNWIDLAQDRDSWRAVVTALKNVRVS